MKIPNRWMANLIRSPDRHTVGNALRGVPPMPNGATVEHVRWLGQSRDIGRLLAERRSRGDAPVALPPGHRWPERVLTTANSAAASFCPSHRICVGAGRERYRSRSIAKVLPSATVARERKHQDRNGYALIEMIVVISVNSVLMAVAAGLIGSLLRTEHQGRHHYERTSALVRLADQFREDTADAHQASVVKDEANASAPAEAGPPVERLRLSGPNERMIEYSRDGERIRRIEYQKQAVVRREAYKVIDLAEAGFAVSDNQVVSLRLRLRDEANAGHDVWRIDAWLARHGRSATGRQP